MERPGVKFVLFFVAAAAMGIAGCGSGGLGQVTGQISVGGKPVTSGTVMFYPKSGPGAVGEIKSDGSYSLSTYRPGDGALIGEHTVAIHATLVGEGAVIEPSSLEEELAEARNPQTGKMLVPGKVTWLVPEKYSQSATSPLKALVNSGANVISFKLPAAE